MLKNKTILIGITGSIAAYKMANVVSMLVKQHCDVHVLMTQNATNFINPITFESLTNNKCHVHTFDRNFQHHIAHISLAQKADLMVIAPASANVISKLSYGIADDMLTTVALAATCPKIIAPAMNTNMYRNAITQNNMNKLKEFGFLIIPPQQGRLACGAIGEGKMAAEGIIMDYILAEIAYEKDLKGLNILVTAGPTQEAIDPVRYITNHSSGKMGYSIAKLAMARGAKVTLISGKTNLTPPPFVEFIPVITAEEMYQQVINHIGEQDILIKAAAVADYRPSISLDMKMKKTNSSITLNLEKTQDILDYVGKNHRKNQFICGFSMETQDLIEQSRAKLVKKNVDMIVANNLSEKDAGFQVNTNKVVFITREKEVPLELMSKEQVANQLLTFIQKERLNQIL